MALATPTIKKTESALREEILAAAMRILQTHGVKKLSQAKVAAEAGIRQSHLTYYFPKKVDLIAGLLQQHIDSASARLDAVSAGAASADMEAALELLAGNRPRMRFFLGLIVEADDNDDIKRMLSEHMSQFDRLVAHFFGRPENDPDVIAYLSLLRGFGMTHMVKDADLESVDVRTLAARFGLNFE